VRSERSVERAHPMAWLVGSLTILWYCLGGHEGSQVVRERPWYKRKVTLDFPTHGGRPGKSASSTHRSPPMAKTRRTFTPESKAEAVRRIADQGKSPAEVARELDLGESLLRSCKQALASEGDRAFPGKGNPPAHEEEMRRLRAEVKRLTMGRDILKRATAFFARESS
jgi:transposase